MPIRWPPTPLGLGKPLNLASSSPETRGQLWRYSWLVPVLGLVTPLIMLSIDFALFSGVSLQRVRDLGSEPLGFRMLVVVYSGITEELLYIGSFPIHHRTKGACTVVRGSGECTHVWFSTCRQSSRRSTSHSQGRHHQWCSGPHSGLALLVVWA